MPEFMRNGSQFGLCERSDISGRWHHACSCGRRRCDWDSGIGGDYIRHLPGKKGDEDESARGHEKRELGENMEQEQKKKSDKRFWIVLLLVITFLICLRIWETAVRR